MSSSSPVHSNILSYCQRFIDRSFDVKSQIIQHEDSMRLFRKRKVLVEPTSCCTQPVNNNMTPPTILTHQMSSVKKDTTTAATRQASSKSSGFVLTKSISSLGRIVGEKWEKITKSKSSVELPANLNVYRQPTPMIVRKHQKKPQLRKKLPLQNLIKAMSWTGRTGSLDLDSAFGPDDFRDTGRYVRFEGHPHCMEKSLSEGALSKYPLPTIDELKLKRQQLARSIRDLERQNRILEYYLANPSLLDTTARETKVERTLADVSSVSKVTNRHFGSQDSLIKRHQRRISLGSEELNPDGCSTHSSIDSIDIVSQQQPKSNKDKLMRTKKLNDLESGYDTDSTRTGARTPDSLPPTTTRLRPEDLTDYEGVDLSVCGRCSLDETLLLEVNVSNELDNTIPVSEASDWTVSELDRVFIASNDSDLAQSPKSRRSCEIIGAITKDGRAISALEMSVRKKVREYEPDQQERSKSEADLLFMSKSEAQKICKTPKSNCPMRRSCEIVGAVTKDGRALSALEMKFEEKIKSSNGMLKFQIHKEESTKFENTRRVKSLTSTNLHTIIMEKGEKRLGFTIVGGTDSAKGKMGIFVKSILSGGLAEEKGELRIRDEILAVNGNSLQGMTHNAALQLIKNAKRGKLVLHVERRDSR